VAQDQLERNAGRRQVQSRQGLVGQVGTGLVGEVGADVRVTERVRVAARALAQVLPTH
jgi:hypothetical protein